MRSETITCDVCGTTYERHGRKGDVVRAYCLRLPSFYPTGQARDGECIELDLCGKCAAKVSEMRKAVESALKQTLDDMKAVAE